VEEAMKRALPIFLFIALTLIIIVWEVQNAAATVTAVLPADVYIGRRTSDGVINTSHLSIFGPNTCTNYGDPFSPWNSLWEPLSYTYHYRILIPSDYPSDILRVELFDPDSINQAENIHSVSYTNNANTLDPANFSLAVCRRSELLQT
jgi:hypothetical protein